MVQFKKEGLELPTSISFKCDSFNKIFSEIATDSRYFGSEMFIDACDRIELSTTFGLINIVRDEYTVSNLEKEEDE
jgi:hypothetical protein